ncbi:MAG: tRNA-dihydrouridine synthase family protein [Oligoflexia bacterium]|nr:tRNA-dihydrouridine synthase family protein [Oligoflexia bacterium]
MQKEIILSPLQGYTDYVYRNVYASCFPYIDSFITPFLACENDGTIRKSKRKDISAENNSVVKPIAQILPGTVDETKILCQLLIENNYTELNLNIGCPFPPVVNKGRGCGLLTHPEQVDKILRSIFNNFSGKVSVKTRTGLNNHNELYKIIPILHAYPISEIIIHARYGKQLYKGSSDVNEFLKYKDLIQIPLVYNGDIDNHNYLEFTANKLKETKKIAIGRGILQDPFLPARIKGIAILNEKQQFINFITCLHREYLDHTETPKHAHTKLILLWEYMSAYLKPELKAAKKIRKTTNLTTYNETIKSLIKEHYRISDPFGS